MGEPGSDNRCQDPVNDQQQQKRSEALSKLRQWQSRISTGMDQILPGLFVGGLREAMNAQLLGENGIKAVVSVHGFSRECQFGPGIATVRLTFSDTSGENVLQHFSTVNSFVHSHRLKQESVLVHCLAGVSRSVCLCLAYLMTVTNLDYPNALDFVGRRHYCAKPNFGFKMQLIKFGQQHSTRSYSSEMRSKICPCSFHSLHLLFLLVFVVLIVLLAPDAEAFVRRPNNGLMKLCPPGGQSFAAAWEITCGMRRRKREVLAPTTTDNNDVEQQQSQQQMTNSNDKGAGEGDGMPEQRPANATAAISNATPKTWWKSIGDILFGRSIIGTPTEDTLASNDEDKQLYRPPSMTEMMLFCCRFGCSLRDLMPFCDPFGAWDS